MCKEREDMPRMKMLKSFAHNLADSYLSTLGWTENDYNSTWLYRAALESGETNIEINIRNQTIEPNNLKHIDILKESLDGLNEFFNSMVATQGIEPRMISGLRFTINIPKLAKGEVNISCVAIAVDSSGKEHVSKPVFCKYDYEI
jgi:hypothetical protein